MNVLLITTISGFLPKFLMQDVRILQEMGYTVHYASNFDMPVYECDRKELEKQGIVCHHVPIVKNPLALADHIAALRQLNQLVEKEKIGMVHCHNPVGGVLGRMISLGNHRGNTYRKKHRKSHEKTCRNRYGKSHGNTCRYRYGKSHGNKYKNRYGKSHENTYRNSCGKSPRKKDVERPYVIYTAHGFYFYKHAPVLNWIAFYPVERLLAHRTDQLITINREDKALAGHFRLKKGGRVVRIPGVGLDPERFRPDSEQRLRYRKEMGVDAGEYLFLSVGELNENKNHETIIRAFSKLNCGHAKLFICGEGKKRKQLQRLIDRLRLRGKIVLPGYCTKIERYYQCADCFLFPSVREGLGMAALEAMACGLPVIAGDNRGTREYIRDNGYLCRSKDTDAFAKAMDLMMRDSGRAAYMGGRSREIAKRFYRERTEKIMRDVYQRMQNSTGKAVDG